MLRRSLKSTKLILRYGIMSIYDKISKMLGRESEAENIVKNRET